jgi:hypothetical protein
MSEDKEYLLKDTVEQERAKVCNIARKLGSKLSGLMLACGILVVAFGAYLLLMPQDADLSPRLNFIFTLSLGFVGILNILCGLLLLLEED